MAKSVMTSAQLVLMLETKKPELQAQSLFCFLYQNDFTPGPGMVWTDFTVCDYDGASGIEILWDFSPVLAAPALAYLQAQPCIFTPTGTGTTNNVYGFAWFSDRDSVVVLAQRFTDAPRTIGATLDPITIVPRIEERSIP